MTGRDPADTVPVKVWRLGRDENDEDVVLLRDEAGRVLPIWIAPCDAAAIWLRIDRDQARSLVRRPMTHDLLLTMMQRLGVSLERIVIDDLSNGKYYATLHLQRNDDRFGLDSRPSDAIALGLRAEVPLFVAEAIMREAARLVTEEGEAESEGEPGDTESD